MKRVLLLCLLLAFLMLATRKADDCMGVTFNNTAGQIVTFDANPLIENLTQKTILVWLNLAAWHGAPRMDIVQKTRHEIADPNGKGWMLDIFDGTPAKTLQYRQYFSTTSGVWNGGANALTTGRHLVGLT